MGPERAAPHETFVQSVRCTACCAAVPLELRTPSPEQETTPALLLQLEAAAEADHAQIEGLVHSSLTAAFQAAHAWQASTLQRQGSGTGACLCSNFLLIADCVMEQDAHLISQQERELLQTFKASPALMQVGIRSHHTLLRS